MLFRKSNKAKGAAPDAAAPADATKAKKAKKAKPAKAKPALSADMYRKPTVDLYTVLLLLSLVAIILGTVFCWMEMAGFDYKFKGGPSVGLFERSDAARLCSIDVTSTRFLDS